MCSINVKHMQGVSSTHWPSSSLNYFLQLIVSSMLPLLFAHMVIAYTISLIIRAMFPQFYNFNFIVIFWPPASVFGFFFSSKLLLRSQLYQYFNSIGIYNPLKRQSDNLCLTLTHLMATCSYGLTLSWLSNT